MSLLVTSNDYNTANQLVATRSYAIEQSNNSGSVARGSGTGEYVEVNMSLRMAAGRK